MNCLQRKKYWRSAGFRRTVSSRKTKRSRCFFRIVKLQKIIIRKSSGGCKRQNFQLLLHPAFCQYTVICSRFLSIFFEFYHVNFSLSIYPVLSRYYLQQNSMDFHHLRVVYYFSNHKANNKVHFFP